VARAVAAGAASPLPPLSVPLKRARGRVLAAPLVARQPHPAFDTAAMDGYAVAGPPPWTVTGRVLAGRGPAGAVVLRPGQAVEIATGALVPPGASAVLPYELALCEGRSVTAVPGGGAVFGAPAGDPASGARGTGHGKGHAHGSRSHIRRRGEEYPPGRELLPAGTLVTPAVLGLAATLGCDALPVHGSPQVAVLVTGDELVRNGLPPAGRVRDALGPLLPGLVEWAGGACRPLTYLPDGRAPLTAELARAAGGRRAPLDAAPWERTADGPGARDGGRDRRTTGGGDVGVVVVCGGSSRGPADHLRPALRELGAEPAVDSVACRPGHPQLLARLPGGPFVVGLPGNPYAALAAAMTLLVPLLGALAGRPEPPRPRARLTAPTRTDATRTRLVPVAVNGCEATPVGHDHPALLWGAAAADALAVVPPGGAADVELIPLPR
jgi:molybdopterin molybdotransferase